MYGIAGEKNQIGVEVGGGGCTGEGELCRGEGGGGEVGRVGGNKYLR